MGNAVLALRAAAALAGVLAYGCNPDLIGGRDSAAVSSRSDTGVALDSGVESVGALAVGASSTAGAAEGPSASAVGPSAPSASVSVQEPPPNILLIIADDMGLDAASFDQADPCYAAGDLSNDAAMPHLAELCRTGVRFTDAWAMPQCSPTRAAMLTGRLPMRTGIGAAVSLSSEDGLPPDEFTLPRAMAAADSGYDLVSIGKWHLSAGADDPRVFGWPFHSGPYGGKVASYTDWTRMKNGSLTPESDYLTTAQLDDALGWLDDHGSAPWLMWLALSAPHEPYHKPPLELFDSGELADYQPGSDVHPYYQAMLGALDFELGRLFDALRARGEWDNTVVVFVGDNGTEGRAVDPPFDPDRAKGTLYEGGVRVPLIVAGPAVRGGARTENALVNVVDVYPTVLELAGVDVESTLAAHAPDKVIDGVSIVPYLKRADAPLLREHMIVQYFKDAPDVVDMGHAVRDERYKLVCYGERVELYDLLADPLELVDRFDGAPAPGFELIYASLFAELVAVTGELGLCQGV